MRALGVGTGDRVIVYMPNMPEAVFAILACARIGAVHSVVFGGFAAASLAARIDDARPRLMVTADAGSRMGKVVRYKPLVDESIALSQPSAGEGPDRQPRPRSTDAAGEGSGRRLEDALRQHTPDGDVDCVWLESNEPSYILYTSGTTGKAEGCTAGRGRSRGGDGRVDQAHLPWRAGRDVLRHFRHRLGGRAFVHHLRPADRGHDDRSLRRGADPSGRRRLVEDRPGLQGRRDVLGADGDPCAEKAGRLVPEEIRPELAQAPVPRRRAARRTDPPLDSRGPRPPGDRSLLADRNRAGRCSPPCRASKRRRSGTAAPRFLRTATTCGCCARATPATRRRARRRWSRSFRRCRPGA